MRCDKRDRTYRQLLDAVQADLAWNEMHPGTAISARFANPIGEQLF